MPTRRIRIRGLGSFTPQQKITSEEIDSRLGLSPGSVLKASGVKERYFASTSETSASMAAAACRQAIKQAEINLDQIDVLISANATMDCGLPHNAAFVHRELGMDPDKTPAFDINMSCLSFLMAVENISWAIAAGRYKNVLIVSSDMASCGLDWKNPESSYIFGDGAAAAVLSCVEDGCSSAILSSKFETISTGATLCTIPAGGSRYHPSRVGEFPLESTFFHMQGPKLFKLVAKNFPYFYQALLSEAHLEKSDIDCVIPHQGSSLAIEHCSRMIDVVPEKLINIFSFYGNQVAASLPTALHKAVETGKLKRGQKAALLGFGAGVSIGGMILEY